MDMKVAKKQTGLFLVFVLFAAALLAIRSLTTGLHLPGLLQDTLTLSLGVLFEALPFVFLGVLLSAGIQLFVPTSFVLRILPKNKPLRRLALSVVGFLFPVCECGNVPLARGLMIKGLRPQDVLTFLLAAPILNPITLLTTSQAFAGQPEITVLRAAGALLIANFIGWFFDPKTRKDIITGQFDAFCETHSHGPRGKKRSLAVRFTDFAHLFREELERLLPSLVFGSVLAGAIQTLVPRDFLIGLASQPVVAILVMLTLAFIVSICANVDAFFALALSGIFPPSAILAFLVFGPMIDIKMLALLRTTYTPSLLLKVSVLVALLTITFSLGVHYAL